VDEGMRNTKKTPVRSGNKREPAQTIQSPGPIDLQAIRERITRLVGNQAVTMVETAIEAVGEGHYQAMKYLFEMIGLYPETKFEDAPQEESLARLLMSRWDIAERESVDAESVSDRNVHSQSNAVK
jgi:hypothetical protein